MANNVRKASSADKTKRTKRSPEADKKILDALRGSADFDDPEWRPKTRPVAAAAAGVAYRTLRDWIEKDAKFSAAVLEAEEEGCFNLQEFARRLATGGVTTTENRAGVGPQGPVDVTVTKNPISEGLLLRLLMYYDTKFNPRLKVDANVNVGRAEELRRGKTRAGLN